MYDSERKSCAIVKVRNTSLLMIHLGFRRNLTLVLIVASTLSVCVPASTATNQRGEKASAVRNAKNESDNKNKKDNKRSSRGRRPATSEAESVKAPPAVVNAANTLATDSRVKAVEEKQKELKQIDRADREARLAIETAVARLVVPKFSLSTSAEPVRQGYKSIADKFQEALISEINRVSYLEAVSSDETLNKNIAQVKSAAAQQASDGVLTGSVRNKALNLALRSGHSGRVLSHWAIPFTLPLEKDENLRDLVQDTVAAVVNSFPYRGYITDVRGDKVKLNIGRQQALQKGDQLSVFEFDQEMATFSSAKNYLGRVVIERLETEMSSGRITSGKDDITEYAKLDFAQDEAPVVVQIKSIYPQGPWAGVGVGSYFLDTKTTGSQPGLEQRLMKVTLTPMLIFSGGWRRFHGQVSLASAGNAVQDVSLSSLRANGSLLGFKIGNFMFDGSIGGFFASTSVNSLVPNTPAALIAHTELAPSAELRSHYILSPRAHLWGLVRGLFPLSSEDALNGKNEATKSFALNIMAGLRIYLDPTWAVDNTFGSDFRMFKYGNGSEISDLSFVISLQTVKAF